ncbi:MAG TPA: DUF362 domain-containing protein [Vicinamibacteria bacterium]|nr:DUF362 domain-containing protein [Vicinamibacteria bacterium]
MSVDVGRRRTLAGLAAGAAAASPLGRAALAFVPGPQPGPKSAPSRPVVAIGRREGLSTPNGVIDPKRLEAALGAAVARAAGEPTAVAAMRRLFRPTDVVGIKVNCLGGRGVSTRPEVALQLAAFLQAAGLPAERIYVWDRSDRELRAVGYSLNAGAGVRVFGTNEAYDERLVDWGPSASRFDRVLAHDLTALVSCAVLKDHGLAGASLSLKNWYGAVHNPNKLHDDNCTPYVPHLVAFPLIRDKLRLSVVDGSLAQCHGGPGRAPHWAWPFGGFLASTDPVAADAVGRQVLEERRKEVGLPPLAAEGREPRHIAGAARLGLGVADLARIERVEV